MQASLKNSNFPPGSVLYAVSLPSWPCFVTRSHNCTKQ